MAAKKKENFENAMKKLEKVVQELETGELPLEKAIETFEEGMRLSAFCSQKLDEAEKKVTLLLQNADGSIKEVPFNQHQDA